MNSPHDPDAPPCRCERACATVPTTKPSDEAEIRAARDAFFASHAFGDAAEDGSARYR